MLHGGHIRLLKGSVVLVYECTYVSVQYTLIAFSHTFVCQCYHIGGCDFNYNSNQNTTQCTTEQCLNRVLS